MKTELQQLARRWVAAIAVVALLITGCAQCRLPRIDPSGERLFLPAPNYTTLESCLPKPAFSAPANPPACATPAVAAGPGCGPQSVFPASATGSGRPGRNQLQLTPTRVVAPVNSEVVLVTGYCGGDGYFITQQPIEWILTPDSVGHFVEVGKSTHENIHRWFSEPSKKLSANYAVGHTSTAAHVITRGTPAPQDDVRVRKGQNWISVTSPTEGSSHVSVLAPKAEGWDQRRQNATIHWIDAQWALPSPAIVRAGQRHMLTTTVTRATNGSPLVGWPVRFAFTEGTPVRFANGEADVEVPTDDNGQAAVEIVPQTNEPGSSNFAIDIIRPATASGDLPRTSIGQGFTTITWSAPGLAVRVTGPDSGQVDSTLSFRVEIANTGDQVAREVVVTDVRPPNLQFIGSNPPAQQLGDRLEWHLGDLPPYSNRILDINVRGVRQGDFQYCFRAQSADGLTAEGCKDRASISVPALSATLTGPQTAEVGQQVEFLVEVTNRSGLPLTNVVLTDRFDPGLAHVQEQGQVISRSLDTLGAGESKRVKISFIVRRPGKLCNTLSVSADGGLAATAQACVQAAAPAGGAIPASANLRVRIAGPDQQNVGDLAEFTLSVTNIGDAPLTNVRIAYNYQFRGSLEPANVTDGPKHIPGELTWSAPLLRPNQTETHTVQCSCLKADPAAVSRLTVTCDQGFTQSDEIATAIVERGAAGAAVPPAASPDRDPPTGIDPPMTGDLVVDIADLANPARVRQPFAYLITLKNNRNVADQNVTMAIKLPDGMTFGKLSPLTSPPTFSQDRKTIYVPAIAEMRAGETLPPFRLEVLPTKPGNLKLHVEIESRRSTKTLVQEKETTVLAQ